jgi:hypothetical protein
MHDGRPGRGDAHHDIVSKFRYAAQSKLLTLQVACAIGSGFTVIVSNCAVPRRSATPGHGKPMDAVFILKAHERKAGNNIPGGYI